MNSLYITLFFNIVAGIVQTFIKSWNQPLYPRVIEVCHLLFELRHDFFLHLIIVVELFPSGNDVMQLSYHHASIWANFFSNFLKKFFRDQRWPTAPLFFVNISPSFGEFTAPLRHILPIHNVTINGNNLFVNFRWTFTFALRNHMTERTSHLAALWIGAAISNTSPSNKTGSTTVKRARLTGKGSRSTAVLP